MVGKWFSNGGEVVQQGLSSDSAMVEKLINTVKKWFSNGCELQLLSPASSDVCFEYSYNSFLFLSLCTNSLLPDRERSLWEIAAFAGNERAVTGQE